MVKMRSWPNFASFNTSIHARSLNERGPHWIFGNAIDLQVSLCAGKKGTGGVCFCLKSNLPWLWLMSLRAEWQVAVVMERSTALPGLFVPGADGWEGVTCARLRDGVLNEDPWPQHSTTNSFAVSRLTCIHTHTHTADGWGCTTMRNIWKFVFIEVYDKFIFQSGLRNVCMIYVISPRLHLCHSYIETAAPAREHTHTNTCTHSKGSGFNFQGPS